MDPDAHGSISFDHFCNGVKQFLGMNRLLLKELLYCFTVAQSSGIWIVCKKTEDRFYIFLFKVANSGHDEELNLENNNEILINIDKSLDDEIEVNDVLVWVWTRIVLSKFNWMQC